MIRKTIVWFGIKLYGLIRKVYGLERNCIQIMNLIVWARSGVGKSDVSSYPLSINLWYHMGVEWLVVR